MRAVTTFALFTAVSASCAENPSLPECAARGSELLQKHAGTSRGAGLQLEATQLMTFQALQQKTAESFARARELQQRSKLLIERSDLVATHKAKSFRRDGTCLENVSWWSRGRMSVLCRGQKMFKFNKRGLIGRSRGPFAHLP